MTPKGCLAINSEIILRHLRLRGWTQRDLAKEMGVHDSNVSCYIKQRYAKVRTIKRIAKALDVVPSVILN